ncbi:ATP-dependent microtubule motor activity protein [Fragilaria crotonensis]|nr:ATP-dependent microtubule motor activity protein [Fragilaria crotonensis]
MSSMDLIAFEPKSDDIIRGEQRIAKALKAENDKLRKDNKDLMDSNFAMETQAKNLEQVIVSVRDEIKEAEVKLDSLQYDVALMEQRMQGSQPEVSTFRHRLNAHAAPARDIEMSIIARKPETNALPTKDEDLRSSLNQARLELRQSQRLLESRSERVDELEKRELSSREEISTLQYQLTNERTLRQQCETHLQAVTTESERLQKVCDELRMSAAVQQDEKENMLGSLQAKEALIEEMREELRKSQAIAAELDVAHERCGLVGEEANESFSDSDSRDSSLDVSTLRILMNPNQPLSSTHIDIRAHAAKMLQFANRAIEKGRTNRSAVSSVVSSVGTEFQPVTTKELMSEVKSVKVPRAVARLGKPPLPSRPNPGTNDDQQVVISNMEKVENTPLFCICQDSLFSGNGEHVEFYLPKLGMACTCGNHKKETSTLDGPDPTALSNILRPWQVEFLSTLNLRNGVDLVHAFNQRGGEMAKAMRKWRKDKKMPSVKTKSCGIALHIWSTTCKAVVKSVRKQKSKGAKVFSRPDFLEVTNNADGRTVSTLGCGSIIDLNAEFLEL